MQEIEKFKKTEDQKKAIRVLSGEALYILLQGGSRSGKTFILLYAMVMRALFAPKSRHLILKRHFNSVKTSIALDTLPKVLDLAFRYSENNEPLRYKIDKQDWYFKFENGSEIWIAGLDDKERADKILGKEYSTIMFNEMTELSYDAVVTALTRLAQKTKLTNKAYFDCNPTNKAFWGYKLFIENIDPEENSAIKNPELYSFFSMNPVGNVDNIGEDYIEKILANMPARKRKRFLDGLWQEDADGALWNSDLINKYRVHKIPDNVEIKRICMGIDPSGDSGKNNDLTTKKADAIGIVTCFKGSDSHYYLLRDDTMNGSPAQWGAKCVEVYEAEKADVMSVEKNFGGAMCEHTIRSMTNNDMIKIKNTTSSKGKLLRAEPISALYEQGLVHHIGNFPELEDEMVSYMGTGNSPNRLDSLVFALTELATPEQYTELLPVMGLRN
jgi:hypothetical protein